MQARASLAGVADIACTLALLASGASHGSGHIAGAAAGLLVFHATRAEIPTGSIGARVGRPAAIALVALGLRGGVVGTALSLGSPDWVAALAGVTVGWAAIGIGSALPSGAPLAPVLLVASLLLRAFYLPVAPFLPEEAYYWNYATHLDIGYLDHPPLVAWLIALGEWLLGHSVAGVRLCSFLCGLVAIFYVYRLSRRLVDSPSSLMAVAAMTVMPYFSFAGGLLMTPEAPLLASWAAGLYFLHRALVAGERKAWLCAGVAIGIGLLAKYTAALLVIAVFAYVLLDKPSRRWLLRWEPYAALAIALALFAPAITWNYQHDWASFAFQSSRRFDDNSRFSLHVLLMNVMIVATPLVLIVLPLLIRKHWTRESSAVPEPELASRRNRLFVGCMTLAPLLVFGWSALSHPPRLNWTGPLWLATLPALGWVSMRGDALRWPRWGAVLRRGARSFLVALLVFDSAVLYYLVFGFPGLPYPAVASQSVGWATAVEQIQGVHDRVMRETGRAPVVVGMYRYFAAAQLLFHASAGGNQPRMRITTKGVVFAGDGLNFEFWDDPQEFVGREFIMVARHKEDLASAGLARYFRQLHAEVHTIPMIHDGPGGDRGLIDQYYYRIGIDYQPVDAAR